jgi:hypothetical protein
MIAKRRRPHNARPGYRFTLRASAPPCSHVALARSIEMAQKPRKAQPASTISTTGKPQDYFAINADYRS